MSLVISSDERARLGEADLRAHGRDGPTVARLIGVAIVLLIGAAFAIVAAAALSGVLTGPHATALLVAGILIGLALALCFVAFHLTRWRRLELMRAGEHPDDDRCLGDAKGL